jgi:hypothetical protein
MNRVALASEGSLLLFFVSAVVGILFLLRIGPPSFENIVLVISLPALASFILLLVSAFVATGMLAVGSLQFPLNFTFPLAHTSIMIAALSLTLGSYGHVVRLPLPVWVATQWSHPIFLIVSLVAQMLLLTILPIWKPKPQAPGPAEPSNP